MKEIEGRIYAVIGGNWTAYLVDFSATMDGAKAIAMNHAKYFKCNTPKIYLASDCERCETDYGTTYLPKLGKNPVAYMDRYGKWWELKSHVAVN